MRKIALDIDDLRVDTFAVTPEPRDGRGTVLAHSIASQPYAYCAGSDEACATYQFRCSGPEWPTCNPTICDCDQNGQDTVEGC
jgi:hypothetical protein